MSFTLEKYNTPASRYTCPGCGSTRCFARYVDHEGNHIADHVGRCNRESKCTYHYKPKEYFSDNNIQSDFQPTNRHANQHRQPPAPKPLTLIAPDIMEKSLGKYDLNHFVTFLTSKFGAEFTKEVVKKYHIGTIRNNGATVFWQVNQYGAILAGKIILYNPSTGKRVKDVKPFWIHTILKLSDYQLTQCLFGLHLTHDNNKPVAIVESEKTSIIASLYFPSFVWIATGGKTMNIKPDFFKPLKGRKVIFFPDIGAYCEWSEKVDTIRKAIPDTDFIISEFLEQKASEADKAEGLDLADYLIRYDLQQFLKPNQPTKQPTSVPIKETVAINKPKAANSTTDNFVQPTKQLFGEDWSVIIESLESFFTNTVISQSIIKIDPASNIANIPLFVTTHLSTVKFNNGNTTFKPYLQRLITLQNLLK